MTREQAIQGILTGIDMVRICKDEGYELLGNGEMGIGNTSSTSACCMALTGLSADEVVGKGGGLMASSSVMFSTVPKVDGIIDDEGKKYGQYKNLHWD